MAIGSQGPVSLGDSGKEFLYCYCKLIHRVIIYGMGGISEFLFYFWNLKEYFKITLGSFVAEWTQWVIKNYLDS